MKKILFLFFITNLFSAPIKLEWKFSTNEYFYFEKYTKQEVLKNGIIQRKRELRDRVDLNVYQLLENRARLKGIYKSYERDLEFEDSNFKLSEVFDLDFAIMKNGEYIVPKEYIMPSIRSIPTFVSNAINPGDMWQAKGTEVFGFKPPVYVPVIVSYQYICNETNSGIDCAKLAINYCLNYRLSEIKYFDIPYKFLGHSSETLWFDYEKGKPVYAENIYDILFIYPDGTAIEYRGVLNGYYNTKKKLEQEQKNKIEDEIAKKIPEDITTKKSDKGLSILLGEVYFEYNSANLTKKGEKILDKIGEVLKQYPNYEVIIEGHTDNIGSAEYNQKLSERRAESVLQYMIEKRYLDYRKSSYIGKGETEPIESNEKESGRSKNRRVEIIIIPQ